MEYRYRPLANNEVEPRVETLGLLARSVRCLQLGIKEPILTWIAESEGGCIRWPHPIAAYTSTSGGIFIRADMRPFDIADAVAHECRHCWQKQQAKRLTKKAAERDAHIFPLEFWNGHERSAGDFLKVGRVLLDREIQLRKAKAAAVRTKTESSDDLRRRLAPIIKARSLAIQRVIDPSGRQGFPSNIEFSAPCATLKLSYSKIKKGVLTDD